LTLPPAFVARADQVIEQGQIGRGKGLDLAQTDLPAVKRVCLSGAAAMDAPDPVRML